MPLFEQFIKEEMSVPQAGVAHIRYDEHTSMIKKGEDILSDKLTASEYKLLRYLLQHPDRIVEREELIDAVWGDNKSTAGITERR